jgi:FMN hydrolase / 5-amino-6-(5-phospho-D-ribitylamino)uracil phosphatase
VIDWVVLDVGETLIDETRVWATWARELGVSPLTFAAALGFGLAQGRAHRSTFELLGFPNWRSHAGAVDIEYGSFRPEDLYPDALSCVEQLQAAGRRVAILANQPARRHAELLALGLRPDVMAMSEELGVSKPDDAFFARSLELMGNPDPRTVAYVGDRVDNDLVPSRRNGLRPIWLRRGPWGRLQQDTNSDAELVIWSLDELVDRLPELDR